MKNCCSHRVVLEVSICTHFWPKFGPFCIPCFCWNSWFDLLLSGFKKPQASPATFRVLKVSTKIFPRNCLNTCNKRLWKSCVIARGRKWWVMCLAISNTLWVQRLVFCSVLGRVFLVTACKRIISDLETSEQDGS